MRYEILYSPDAEDHVAALSARNQSTIITSVERQLSHQPHVPTKNRKPLKANPLAPWELRIGEFRVYYDIDVDAARVNIRAVGVKVHSQVYIAGEEIDL